MKYAGIGSRTAPMDVLKRIRDLATTLAHMKFELHTGGALGCDKAFIDGHHMAGKDAYLWLPWQYYNGYITDLPDVDYKHLDFTKKYHPAWNKCSEKAKIMHARNAQILLGNDLDDPVKFVVCWTPNGELKGGTAQGLRIAIDYNIPIFNLASDGAEEDVFNYIKTGKLPQTFHNF